MDLSAVGGRIRVGLLIVLAVWSGGTVTPTVSAQTGTISLGLTVNDPAISPGDTLVAGVTVDNPAGGPLADVFFVILLPDGTTTVSLTPGGPRPGTLTNLRTLAPVVRGITLASAFSYRNAAFFTYAFSGIEPTGQYRVFFAAARAGALDDGAIGAGDLLAVATQDFTVGASPVVVDSTRSVTVTVSPTGGVAQTSAANGTGLALNVPRGAVRTATAITVAPLAAFPGIPSGPLVAGVSAEPSGLHFDEPATLTITLPAGFQPPPFGLMGFLADRDGRNLQAIPVDLTGNVVTLTVPHFSVAGVTLASDWMAPCASPSSTAMTTACQQLRPLYDAEVARLNSQGGPLSLAFKADVGLILLDWAQDGILPRLRDAQLPGAPDPFLKPSKVLSEWFDWVRNFYEPVFGDTFDRTNQAAGLPIGALIDQLQGEARLTFRAGRDAITIKCLADKANVRDYLEKVESLYGLWFLPLPAGFADETVEYCAAVRVDAFAPPVLTPGLGSAMPIDVRLRFIDGQDLPGGELLSVSIAATNATVSPAGGVLPSPIARTVTLTPSSTNSVVTISAAATEPGLRLLPLVTKTFQAGQSLPLDLSNGELSGNVLLKVNGSVPRGFSKSQDDRGLPGASLDFAIPTYDTMIAQASGRVTATRNIALGSGAVTASLTSTVQLELVPRSPQQTTLDVEASVADAWRVTLPTAFTVVAVVRRGAEISISGVQTPLRNGDTATLNGGQHSILFVDRVKRTLAGGVLGGEASATPGYTLTFTPVP